MINPSKKITDARKGKQSLEELWRSISKLSTNVSKDNKLYDGEYPVAIRKSQIFTLKVLISEIEAHHRLNNSRIADERWE